MVYLFSGAVIFIVYLEIYEFILKKRTSDTVHKSDNPPSGSDNGGLEFPEMDEATSEATLEATDEAIDVDINSQNRQYDTANSDSELNNQPSNTNIVSSSVETELPNESTDHQSISRQGSIHTIYTMDTDVPDDVFDYITMHHATATMASEETNYFLQIGLLGEFGQNVQ